MTQRYSDIDTTYLYTATQRIAAGLEDATDIAATVYGTPQQKPVAPYWAVDVIDFEMEELSEHHHVQTWMVASYLVYVPPVSQQNESVYPTIWRALPQAIVYMQAHKRLVFSDTDTEIDYLNALDVQINIQRINEGQAGFAIVHRLPFSIVVGQE